MTGWQNRVLGDICAFQAGDAFPQSKQGRLYGDHPFIKVSDMNLAGNELYISCANNWISNSEAQDTYRLHPANSVVFAKIGIALTYNRRRRLTRPTAIDNNMMSAVPSSSVDPVWFYYLTTTLDFNLISSGSALPYLTVKDLSKMECLLPPLSEQRAIAAVLGALDDKIELNRRMNATLEQMARALFKSWFIDFDPVRAKMEGRQPFGMDTATASLFPSRLTADGLPEGWEMSTIGKEFDITMGQSPPGETYNESGDGLPFYQGRTDFGFRYPTRRIFCTQPNRIAEEGDTLISVRAPVGDINMAFEKCILGRGVGALRHKSKARSYSYYAIGSIQDALKAFEADGTVFGSINKQDVEKLSIVNPSLAIIEAFEQLISSVDERILLNTWEGAKLEKTRDYLLPKLISGDIRIPDAEKFVEAV